MYTKQDEQYTYELFDGVCYNCGAKEDLCIDHNYPLSRGYALTRKNAVLLCRSCNSSKLDKLPKYFYTNEKLQILKEKLGV